MLLFAVDIEVAGSPSLVVSLPTMLVAFSRYRRDDSFTARHQIRGSLAAMAATAQG